MAPARVTRLAFAIALAGVLATPARAGTTPPCEGRWVIARVRGGPTLGAADAIVLDAAGAVVDPACEAATLRVRGRRVTARWHDCRNRRRLTLRVRASADCTVLRGTLAASGARASRFVATTSRCGDGIPDPGRGERCDDGNLANDDGCDASCGGCVDPATLSSTWAAVQANVFDRACTACHGDQPTAGLDLRAPGSYAAIVDVPAASGLFKVKAGDHTQSLLWLKMAKTSLGGLDELPGGGMPFGYPLPPAIVEAFGAWIDAGAPADGYVPGAEALLAPCDGAKSGAITEPATPAYSSGR